MSSICGRERYPGQPAGDRYEASNFTLQRIGLALLAPPAERAR